MVGFEVHDPKGTSLRVCFEFANRPEAKCHIKGSRGIAYFVDTRP
jgi:hypothetical protein